MKLPAERVNALWAGSFFSLPREKIVAGQGEMKVGRAFVLKEVRARSLPFSRCKFLFPSMDA